MSNLRQRRHAPRRRVRAGMNRWAKLAIFVALAFGFFPWWQGLVVEVLHLERGDGNLVYLLWCTVAGWQLWKHWSTPDT